MCMSLHVCVILFESPQVSLHICVTHNSLRHREGLEVLGFGQLGEKHTGVINVHLSTWTWRMHVGVRCGHACDVM